MGPFGMTLPCKSSSGIPQKQTFVITRRWPADVPSSVPGEALNATAVPRRFQFAATPGPTVSRRPVVAGNQHCPLGSNRTQTTSLSCPFKVNRSFPVAASQILTCDLRWRSPRASVGRKIDPIHIVGVPASRHKPGGRDGKSQTRAVRSRPADAIREPSRENVT